MDKQFPNEPAWLLHKDEIAYVDIPSLFEMDRLGLELDKIILTEKQVDLRLDRKFGRAVIVVKEIEIVSIDKENREMTYRIVGSKSYLQPWEVGGSHLAPSKDRYRIP